MKELAQIFLIAGGGLGLLGSLPIAYYAWAMTRGFGSNGVEHLIILSPLICLAAIVVGIIWHTAQAPKSLPTDHKLPKDAPSNADGAPNKSGQRII